MMLARSIARSSIVRTRNVRLFSQTSKALSDGTVRGQIKKRQRQTALQEAFKFGDDEDEDNAILNARKNGTQAPIIEEAPNLEFLAKRWDKIDPLEQEEIALYLEQRMRSDWHELTDLEREACKYLRIQDENQYKKYWKKRKWNITHYLLFIWVNQQIIGIFVAYGPWGPRTPQMSNPVFGYDLFMKIIVAAMVGVGGYQFINGKFGYLSSSDEEK